MTIALATRGYLFPFLCTKVVVGPGPSIVGAVEAKPEIAGAVPTTAVAPTLVGSVVPGPTISGGVTSSPPAGTVAPPSITGGVKPKIG